MKMKVNKRGQLSGWEVILAIIITLVVAGFVIYYIIGSSGKLSRGANQLPVSDLEIVAQSCIASGSGNLEASFCTTFKPIKSLGGETYWINCEYEEIAKIVKDAVQATGKDDITCLKDNEDALNWCNNLAREGKLKADKTLVNGKTCFEYLPVEASFVGLSDSKVVISSESNGLVAKIALSVVGGSEIADVYKEKGLSGQTVIVSVNGNKLKLSESTSANTLFASGVNSLSLKTDEKGEVQVNILRAKDAEGDANVEASSASGKKGVLIVTLQ